MNGRSTVLKPTGGVHLLLPSLKPLHPKSLFRGKACVTPGTMPRHPRPPCEEAKAYRGLLQYEICDSRRGTMDRTTPCLLAAPGPQGLHACARSAPRQQFERGVSLAGPLACPLAVSPHLLSQKNGGRRGSRVFGTAALPRLPGAALLCAWAPDTRLLAWSLL